MAEAGLGKKIGDSLISAEDSNEIFNSVSHGIGAILSAGGLAVLVILSALEGKWVHLVSFALYGASLFFSMLSSTLLHSFLGFGKYKRILGILDHAAIYLLITRTIAPFAIAVVGGAFGWAIFGVAIGISAVSIAVKAAMFSRLGSWFSVATYLTLGWLGSVFVVEIERKLGVGAVLLAVLGGLLYTFGFVIFLLKRPNPFPPFFGWHEIWHSCVLAGNASFFFLMLFFVLPFSA